MTNTAIVIYFVLIAVQLVIIGVLLLLSYLIPLEVAVKKVIKIVLVGSVSIFLLSVFEFCFSIKV